MHDLAAVVINDDITFTCVCGATFSGRTGQRWVVKDNGNGTVALWPSVAIEGHFHAYYSAVPSVKTLGEAQDVARARRAA